MGLPVWRAPSPQESREATKLDLNAPNRSPIRRRGRGSPVLRRVHRRSSSSNTQPTAPTTLHRSPQLSGLRFVALPPHRHSTDPARRPSPSSRSRFPPPPVPEPRNYSRNAPEAPRYQYPFSSLRTMPDNMPEPPVLPSPSTFHRWDHLPPNFGEVTRHLPSLTPDFAPARGMNARETPSRSDTPQEEHRRSGEPRFRVDSSSELPPTREAVMGLNDPPPGVSDTFMIVEDGEDEGSDNNAVPFPPLRRMGRRTIADGPLPSSSLRESWSPATTLDGLGDRERSISPPDDHYWETMLSTVAPDPLPPTAESSFASTAASQSFSNSNTSSRSGSSNSNSASSSRTPLTIPSRRQSPDEFLAPLCDTSESDSASDTEEEDMNTGNAPWHERRYTYRGSADEPPRRNRPHVPHTLRELSRERRALLERAGRHYQDRPNSSLRAGSRPHSRHTFTPLPPLSSFEPPSRSSSFENRYFEASGNEDLEQELQEARAILERLSRRVDVGDAFWASVGLTPRLAEGVDRVGRREE